MILNCDRSWSTQPTKEVNRLRTMQMEIIAESERDIHDAKRREAVSSRVYSKIEGLVFICSMRNNYCGAI